MSLSSALFNLTRLGVTVCLVFLFLFFFFGHSVNTFRSYTHLTIFQPFFPLVSLRECLYELCRHEVMPYGDCASLRVGSSTDQHTASLNKNYSPSKRERANTADDVIWRSGCWFFKCVTERRRMDRRRRKYCCLGSAADRDRRWMRLTISCFTVLVFVYADGICSVQCFIYFLICESQS